MTRHSLSPDRKRHSKPHLTANEIEEINRVIRAQEEAGTPNWTAAAAELAKKGIVLYPQTIGRRAQRLGVESQRQKKIKTAEKFVKRITEEETPDPRVAAQDLGLAARYGKKLADRNNVRVRYAKPSPTKNAIVKILEEGSEISDREIYNLLINDFEHLSIKTVGQVRREYERGNAQRVKGEKREATYSQRGAILQSIVAGKKMKDVVSDSGFAHENIVIMARNSWVQVGKDLAIDTEQFLAAADELVRRQLTLVEKDDLTWIVKRYLFTIPAALRREMDAKYQPAGAREEAVDLYLSRMPNEELEALIDSEGRFAPQIAGNVFLESFPEKRLKEIINLRLNRCHRLNIEPNAVLAFSQFSIDELRTLMIETNKERTSKDRPEDLVPRMSGWIRQFEGVREWPDRPFLDSFVTHYLVKGGILVGAKSSPVRCIKDAAHFQSLTDKGYVKLRDVPANVIHAAHCCLAIRGVTINRLKLRNATDQGVERAPSRAEIELLVAETVQPKICQL